MTLVFASLLVTGLAAPETVELKAAGLDRSMLVYSPKVKSDRVPLVLVFHGHGGGSRQIARGFPIYDEIPDAWVVYPQGLTGVKGITDPEGAKTGWQKNLGDLDDRDLKLVDAIVKWAKEKGIYSADRTFVTGHSNGSQFTWLVQATRGAGFAGFAGMCAPGGREMVGAPEKPMMIVAGKEDPIVQFKGIERFAELMARRVGVAGDSTTDKDGAVWHPARVPFVTYYYEGGHKYPPQTCRMVAGFFKKAMDAKP